MATRASWNRRALRPGSEFLENRRLMAARVTGVDIDGDEWILSLVGPGDITVLNQPTEDGELVPLGQPALIQEIIFGGTLPLTSRIIGEVNQGPNGDGVVVFESMTQIGGQAFGSLGNNGIFAIDMPDFILGDTSPDSDEGIGTPRAFMNLPDGVISLRFGGADITQFFGDETDTPLNENGRDDFLEINLSIPKFIGTTVVVDQIVSSGEEGATPGTGFQDGVVFNVTGRLNTFQANEILGNSAVPSNGFDTTGNEGTFINSDPAGTADAAIGEVRIGGEATNFAVNTSGRVTDFFIGGETDNVVLVSSDGSRNIEFGRGMDTVVIVTDVIETLTANRGAVNSTVLARNEIGRALFGGDVVSTLMLSGYEANLTGAAGPAPEATPGGGMSILIGGDVLDSVFAASFEPGAIDDTDTAFDSPDSLVLPAGEIDAKVAGIIDNQGVTPLQPETAFFAERARVEFGPVIPPMVPEPPFEKPSAPKRAVGLIGPFTPREGIRLQALNLLTPRNVRRSIEPFPIGIFEPLRGSDILQNPFPLSELPRGGPFPGGPAGFFLTTPS